MFLGLVAFIVPYMFIYTPVSCSKENIGAS
jgi:hypothetical protein